jgi:NAD(P)-dependent dehydrogenase (short-subunit alcohol dehydrogenase family)/SAM-dependent methyltransferase/acyl carrier protein
MWPRDAGPYLTHATFLDTCAAVARAAVGAGDEFDPTGMRAFALSQPLGSSAWIYARVAQSPDALDTDLAFFAEDGTPAGYADKLRLVRGDAAERWFASDWLYEVAWRRLESADRPDGPGLSALVPVAALDGAVQARAAHLTTETGVRAYGSALGALESLATAFVVDALRTLGWHAEVGTRITEPEMARALGVVSGHRRLLCRLLEMLEEDGILVPAAGGWEVARELPPGEPAIADAGAAIGQVAAHELTLLTRCGQHLAGALRGEVDALELLFPGGATEGTEQVYSASPVARLFNGLVTEAVETLARSLPTDRSLRILEVGAGTGGTTAAVLAAVPAARTRYVLTDLSPLFLQRAAEKFRHYPFVEYALYDAERDASAQPLPLSEFDLIVAANVLHATRDLRATVERLTALLAPGGMVLFAEATRPQRWLDLTFGLTEGWWRFNDRELRPRHALLPRRGWTDLLDALEFEGAVALPHVPDPHDPVEGHALLLASWPARPRERRGAIGGRPWLVLGDASGLGAAIARRLLARGDDCVEARVGSTTAAVGEKLWTVDPTAGEGLSRLMALALPGGTAGVIDCWPLDAPAIDAASPESLERATALVCGGALLSVQALVAARSDARLWVVTRDAMAAAPNDAARGAVQAAAWGLGRVVALEQPEVWGGLIDVADDGDLHRTAARIVQRLDSSHVEDQVALRPGGTFVARLASAGPMRAAPAEFRRDATYLVTGGTGGVGLLIAGEMARLGAGHLVLVSRSGVPARDRWDDVEPGTEGHRQVTALREIEALGTAVTVQTADITAPDQVSALMDVLRGLSPLRGVVHAAAHIETGRVRDLSLDRMATMLRPKVTGTWLLDRATRDADLDFFVLFSSTAGVFGATDLAHYAAANVFLDSFAHARTAAGRPAVSIAWGTWAQIRGSDDAHRSIDRGGLKIMPRERTLEAFRRLARPACPQLVFADVDWGTLKPLYETRRRRPIFDEVGARPVPQTTPGPAPVGVRERLQQARPNERRAVLLAHVRQEAAQVLGLQPTQVDPRKGLFDLGMDSLMSVDLKGRLEASLGVRMPTTLTFNYPSVGAITDYVDGLLPEAPDGAETTTIAAAEAAAAPGGADPDPDESLSEDELATLLAAQLEKMRQ